MHSGFSKSLVGSGVAHLLVLLVFIVAPSWFAPRRAAPVTIELVNPADLLPPPVTSVAPEPPRPDSRAEISRTTLRTTRQTTRQTTSARPTSSTTTQQTTRATTSARTTTSARPTTSAPTRRTTTMARTTSRPALDTDALRERLQDRLRTNTAGASSGGRIGTPGVASGRSDWYHGAVERALYDAWRTPPHARRGLFCNVEMRVDRDGAIVSSRITRGSGDPEVDASALEAVRSVGRLPPLPQSIEGRHKDFIITFKVEGGA